MLDGVVEDKEPQWAANLGVGDWNPLPDRLPRERRTRYLSWLLQLNPVLTDFDADFPGQVRAVWHADPHWTVSDASWTATVSDPNPTATLWDAEGSGTGIDVSWDPPYKIEMAHVLDALVEAAWAVGGDASWPACPRHPRSHPLVWGGSDEGALSWVCARDHAALARVGELAAARATWRQLHVERAGSLR